MGYFKMNEPPLHGLRMQSLSQSFNKHLMTFKNYVTGSMSAAKDTKKNDVNITSSI